ncbi:hypothetical protein QFC19_002474 [Naganishia cerealis]|uniref:Uncharacterized protein n=1 Tax=Naganishia cerealis TaxID=610337 RepID=A0ACC2WC97_9TREE|nr:hypothetical protein QFC19_002474 [Naganishia cerealis]
MPTPDSLYLDPSIRASPLFLLLSRSGALMIRSDDTGLGLVPHHARHDSRGDAPTLCNYAPQLAIEETASQSRTGTLTSGVLLSTTSTEKSDTPAAPTTPANPLTDPAQMEGMMDGMKKQAVMMIPNMVIMQWINVFFSGFVLIKLPFPLTYGFKPMLQRDIATPDMPVQYVSALSWYFLNLFGLNGLFKLLLSSSDAGETDGTRDMNLVHSLGGGTAGPAQPAGMGGQADMGKVHRAEAENLALAEGMYCWAGQGVEERVLALWGMAEVAR